MKFLFRRGSVALVTDPPLSRSYGEWLQIIAQQATAKEACLEVTGHTSRTGPPAGVSAGARLRSPSPLVARYHDSPTSCSAPEIMRRMAISKDMNPVA